MNARFALVHVALVASALLTAACGGANDSSSSDEIPKPAPGAAVQALGVSAYEALSSGGDAATLGARLLDAQGAVRGEIVRVESGRTLAFEMFTGDVVTALTLSEGGGSLTVDGEASDLGSAEGALIQAVVLDPAFHSLGGASESLPGLEQAESALASTGTGISSTLRRCYDGCSSGHVDCQFGNYPEVCDDVYDACIRLCDAGNQTKVISRGGVVAGGGLVAR